MCASIREFGFKIPVLARSDGEVVDGHLRLKAARKLGSWPGGDTDVVIQRWQTLSARTAKLEADGRTFEEIAAERRKGAE